MTDHGHAKVDVDQFLLNYIDTVPHLEALLLLWNSRPNSWSAEEMAHRLFLAPEAAADILGDLVRQRLVTAVPDPLGVYCYEPEPDRDRLLASVDAIYRHELIRISRLIHSKPSAAVRAFARAFRLKKERE